MSILQVDFVPSVHRTLGLASFYQIVTIFWSCLAYVIPRLPQLIFWVFQIFSHTFFKFLRLRPQMAGHIHRGWIYSLLENMPLLSELLVILDIMGMYWSGPEVCLWGKPLTPSHSPVCCGFPLAPMRKPRGHSTWMMWEHVHPALQPSHG